ncbi:uncharacterized protein V1513DRAFT_459198 [Lipomyces chichibuensis]|uniref:uncharacterized protein n=1 Tax=Lipomyces chichibuensis TaxID=1546026 RepID=UPI003343406E
MSILMIRTDSPERCMMDRSLSMISRVPPHRICGYSNAMSFLCPRRELVMPFLCSPTCQRRLEDDNRSPQMTERTQRTQRDPGSQNRFSEVLYSGDMLSPTKYSARGVREPQFNIRPNLDECYCIIRSESPDLLQVLSGERREHILDLDYCQEKERNRQQAELRSRGSKASMEYMTESNRSNASVSITFPSILPALHDNEPKAEFSNIESSDIQHSALSDKEYLSALATETLSHFGAQQDKPTTNRRTSKCVAFLKKCKSYADIPHARTFKRRQRCKSETFTIHIDSATEDLADVDIPATWFDSPRSSTLRMIDYDEESMMYVSPRTRIAKKKFDRCSPIVLVRGNTGDSDIERIFPAITIVPKVTLTLPDESDSEQKRDCILRVDNSRSELFENSR